MRFRMGKERANSLLQPELLLHSVQEVFLQMCQERMELLQGESHLESFQWNILVRVWGVSGYFNGVGPVGEHLKDRVETCT